MKRFFVRSGVFALAFVTGVAAYAQGAAAPRTRAEVRAEAAASNKGAPAANAPQGESSTSLDGQPNMTPRPSANVRARVRKEAATAPGPTANPMGEGATGKPAAPRGKSALSRAQVGQSARPSRARPSPGSKGERLAVPTNPAGGAGTPN